MFSAGAERKESRYGRRATTGAQGPAVISAAGGAAFASDRLPPFAIGSVVGGCVPPPLFAMAAAVIPTVSDFVASGGDPGF